MNKPPTRIHAQQMPVPTSSTRVETIREPVLTSSRASPNLAASSRMPLREPQNFIRVASPGTSQPQQVSREIPQSLASYVKNNVSQYIQQIQSNMQQSQAKQPTDNISRMQNQPLTIQNSGRIASNQVNEFMGRLGFDKSEGADVVFYSSALAALIIILTFYAFRL